MQVKLRIFFKKFCRIIDDCYLLMKVGVKMLFSELFENDQPVLA